MYVAVENGAVDHGDDLRSVRADSAYHLGSIAGLVNEVARIDPLRRKAQVKVRTALQTAALLQNGTEQFLGGTGVGGGFQHHNGAPPEMLGNGDGGIPDVADIRLLVLVQRGGNADSDKVYIPNKTEIGGGRQHSVLYQCLQIGIDHIADIVLSGIDHIHLFPLHIEADGLKAMLRLIHCQRQTDIAQAADAHDQCLILNFLNQLFLYGHIHSTFI